MYQKRAVACCEGDDVGTGDDAGAEQLHVGLDPVDHLVAAHGVHVREGRLLADEAAHVIQKNGSVTALYT